MNIRIWLLAVASAILIVCFPIGVHADNADFAASWWRSLNQVEQGAAIVGAIEGYTNGVQHGIIEGIGELAKGPAPKNMSSLTAHKYYVIIEQTTVLANRPLYSHTVAFYVAGVSDFYDRYPSSHRVRLGVIVACLADNPVESCAKVAATGT